MTAQSVAPDVETAQAAQLKVQVRNFEAILRAAVESGGRRLAARAQEALPDLQVRMAMVGEPSTLGVPLPEGGLLFTVQVPDIMPSYLMMVEMVQRRMQPQQGVRPVSTAPPGTAAVPEDPMKPLAGFIPDREYSDFVREALMDAMVENSLALNVGNTADLIIVATVPDNVRRDPLDNSRLLILSVKGEHLTAYRQGKISKDEAKLKIVDRRF